MNATIKRHCKLFQRASRAIHPLLTFVTGQACTRNTQAAFNTKAGSVQ
jgi:hypothetical protein